MADQPRSDKDFQDVMRRFSAHKSIGMGSQPAFVVLDMTNAFVEDRYPTGYSKTGIPCVKSIKELMTSARRAKLRVIYTIPLHSDKEYLGGRWKNLSISKEAMDVADQIYPELTPQEQDIIVEKYKPSGFFGTQLMSILNYLRIDTLIITGMTTSGCIRATVVDAFSYNLRVIIPRECVADRFAESHTQSLFDMNMKYCDVVSSDEVRVILDQIAVKN